MKGQNLGYLMLVAVIISCQHHPEKMQVPTDLQTDTVYNCDPNWVYYINDVQPILNNSCAFSGCHDAQTKADGIDLSSYAAFMSNDDLVSAFEPDESELYEVIIENDPSKIMPPPPFPALSNHQIQIIYKWIKQGAKNDFCANDCDTNQFSFQSVIFPIIQQNCLSCHSNTNPQGGVVLSDYNAVVNAVNNQNLLPSVQRLTGAKAMPPAAALRDCEIRQIEKWIAAGMQND